ncbi:polyunsaturated fatty acid 5-lipoxygenase-like [Sycon ciliatum]|uniref:polyunsaturated fatty acid 5-lipoxygenase-like n=1 Tax=Sycon ciliatum TaxID=27933 RepID=UPI0031F71979
MGNAHHHQVIQATPPPPNASLKINVKSGRVLHFGPGHGIILSFIDDGNRKITTRFTMHWVPTRFKSGDEEVLFLGAIDDPNFGEITTLELQREKWNPDSSDISWFCDMVTIKYLKRSFKDGVFPVHRYVGHASPLQILNRHSCLPQAEPWPLQRAQEIEHKRRGLVYSAPAQGMMPMAHALPYRSTFHDHYGVCKIEENRNVLKKRCKFDDVNSFAVKKWKEINKLYVSPYLLAPKCIKYWRSDEYFGQLRLSGPNPFLIRRCTGIPFNCAITPNLVDRFLEGQSLQTAIEAKKIYIVNFEMMVVDNDTPRKCVQPIGLFYVNKAGDLMPIAIQLEPSLGGARSPVFLPSDPAWTWTAAKMWFNSADAAYHMAVAKLSRCNFVLETFALAIHRNFSSTHPLFQLVAPHIRYIFDANRSSAFYLLNLTDGYIDFDFSLGRRATFSVIQRDYRRMKVSHRMFQQDLVERGVDDPSSLPNYHYRDDGLLYDAAIKNYVYTVVESVYSSPEDLIYDHELQSFAHEISDGRLSEPLLRGLPMEGKFTNTLQIGLVFAHIIFTATAHFGATHNTMYENYAWPPNYPSFLRGLPPDTKEKLKETDVIAMIPERPYIAKTLLIMDTLQKLTVVHLGDYDVEHSVDQMSHHLLEMFRKDLKEIAKHIERVNKKRKFSYKALLPNKIPNCPFS